MTFSKGDRVYCNNEEEQLNDAPGTVHRTELLGCVESVSVQLDTGEFVAFFGDRLSCVTKAPVTAEEPPRVLRSKKTIKKKS